MRSPMHLVFGIIVAVGSVTALAAASADIAESAPAFSADSAAVAEVVRSFHEALSQGDSSAALGLLAPDAIILESGGMETRGEYRSHHLVSDIAFARAVKSVRAPIEVTLAGSTAWTSSTSTTQGQFNGRTINSVGAESMVLSKAAGGWKIRSIHWSSRNRRPPAQP